MVGEEEGERLKAERMRIYKHLRIEYNNSKMKTRTSYIHSQYINMLYYYDRDTIQDPLVNCIPFFLQVFLGTELYKAMKI